MLSIYYISSKQLRDCGENKNLLESLLFTVTKRHLHRYATIYVYIKKLHKYCVQIYIYIYAHVCFQLGFIRLCGGQLYEWIKA